MIAPTESSREFRPGTTGWSVEDLDDPALRRQWESGRYEIVYGVLAVMPAAMFDHSAPMGKLVHLLEQHFEALGEVVYTATEVDLVLDRNRVLVADAVLLTREDMARQRAHARPADAAAGRVGSLVVPPTLVVESVSEGHEAHDERFKREQYAGFGVPHYWIVSYIDRSLRCLVLRGDTYVEDTQAQRGKQVLPTAFAGLTIPLERLFV